MSRFVRRGNLPTPRDSTGGRNHSCCDTVEIVDVRLAGEDPVAAEIHALPVLPENGLGNGIDDRAEHVAAVRKPIVGLQQFDPGHSHLADQLSEAGEEVHHETDVFSENIGTLPKPLGRRPRRSRTPPPDG